LFQDYIAVYGVMQFNVALDCQHKGCVVLSIRFQFMVWYIKKCLAQSFELFSILTLLVGWQAPDLWNTCSNYPGGDVANTGVNLEHYLGWLTNTVSAVADSARNALCHTHHVSNKDGCWVR